MNNYADHPPRCFNENRNTVEKALRRERRISSSFLHPQSALICWQIKSASVLCRDGNVKSDNFKISTMEATEKNYFIVFYVRKTTQRQIEIHLQRKDHRITS